MCWPGLLNSSNFFTPKFTEHIFIRIISLPWDGHHIIPQLKTLIGFLPPRGPKRNSSHIVPAPFQQSHFLTIGFSSIQDILPSGSWRVYLLLRSIYTLHILNLSQDAHFTFTYQSPLAPLIINLKKSYLIWEAIFWRKHLALLSFKSPLH